jgi:hypothetical protein
VREEQAKTKPKASKAEELEELEAHADLLDKPSSEARAAFEKVIEIKLPLPKG